MSKPVEVISFGCRLNAVESATIERLARQAGRQNLVVINSCAVTAEAVKQVRQSIRRVARQQPDAEIIVTGCAAEANRDSLAQMPEISGFVANRLKTEAASWYGGAAGPMPAEPRLQALADAMAGHTRAFVQVQNGCDHQCTFCIIPAGRGPSRSVALTDVVEAVARLSDAGTPEVVLTGVDLTSWQGRAGEKLGHLVKAILAGAPTLKRLRLSSIDSIEADETLIEAIACESRLMPHLHLSLQAGDDLILKRMKRRHNFADAARFCQDIRKIRPDIVFGADIIAGFPTETEAMFARSLDLVEACGLTHLHVFPFSPRPGTPAARMPAVAPVLVRERAARLRAAGDKALQHHLAQQSGRKIEVLAENGGIGRAADFTPVLLPPGRVAGELFAAQVSGHDGKRKRLVAAAATG